MTDGVKREMRMRMEGGENKVLHSEIKSLL